MSNIRLFYSKSLSLNLTDKLDKSQSHYVSKVMRLKEKEVFSLFNSSGEWEAKILNITKSIVEFNVTKQLRQKENNKDLWLAFSPIKSNYFNFMIQKATELGVTKFLPIIFERTIVRKINKDVAKKVVWLLNGLQTIEISEISIWHRDSYVNVQKQKQIKLNESRKNMGKDGEDPR